MNDGGNPRAWTKDWGGGWFLILLNLTGKIAATLVAFTAPSTALALWFVPDALLGYHLFVVRAQGLLAMHRRFVTPRRDIPRGMADDRRRAGRA